MNLSFIRINNNADKQRKHLSVPLYVSWNKMDKKLNGKHTRRKPGETSFVVEIKKVDGIVDLRGDFVLRVVKIKTNGVQTECIEYTGYYLNCSPSNYQSHLIPVTLIISSR